jgi:hypothetical protein
MLKMRDCYLHTNCLAALANMSGLFKHLQMTDSLSLRRTIQYNMLKMRDRYLHPNCLAALANISGQFNHLQMTNSLSLCRTIQYNMLKMHDRYLHTNCLAALANMSGLFKHLHPYVDQRLVSLFETLARYLNSTGTYLLSFSHTS